MGQFLWKQILYTHTYIELWIPINEHLIFCFNWAFLVDEEKWWKRSFWVPQTIDIRCIESKVIREFFFWEFGVCFVLIEMDLFEFYLKMQIILWKCQNATKSWKKIWKFNGVFMNTYGDFVFHSLTLWFLFLLLVV